MKTIREILLLSTEYLAKKKIENPRYQSELLISDILKIARMDLYLQFDRPLNQQEITTIREALTRRGKGEPLQYIHGKVEFYGCTIKVSNDVLIPRQETEILVDAIVTQLKKETVSEKILWDICTGSGCIGIAIKKALPQLKVVLSDISQDSLKIAEENAKINHVEVQIRQGDLLTPFKNEQANYIVCNPPYVSNKDSQTLSKEVINHEPKLALIAGPSGLEYYQRMAESLKPYLYPTSKVWFEIGHNQGSKVIQIFQNEGWKHCSFEKDWSGHDRFFSLENE